MNSIAKSIELHPEATILIKNIKDLKSECGESPTRVWDWVNYEYNEDHLFENITRLREIVGEESLGEILNEMIQEIDQEVLDQIENEKGFIGYLFKNIFTLRKKYDFPSTQYTNEEFKELRNELKSYISDLFTNVKLERFVKIRDELNRRLGCELFKKQEES